MLPVKSKILWELGGSRFWESWWQQGGSVCLRLHGGIAPDPVVLCRADLWLQAGASSGIFVLLLRVALVSLFSVCTLVCSCSLVYVWVVLPGFALFG